MSIKNVSVQPQLSQKERTELMLKLCEVVRRTGQFVIGMNPSDVHYTQEEAGHQYSTADSQAAIMFRSYLADVVGTFPGSVIEEFELGRTSSDKVPIFPLCVFDAIEGSMSATRGLAARIKRPLCAGVSALVLEQARLYSIAASAFYDFMTGSVFSSIRVEAGSFLAFQDGQLIRAETFWHSAQNSTFRPMAVAPCYSHDNVEEQAHIKRALLSAGFRVTEGCESSAQDLLNILSNRAEAYVDLRALFPGGKEQRDEVLKPCDVGGLLPVMDAVGYKITDAFGKNWQNHIIWDPLSLVLSTPALHLNILKTLVQQLPYLSGDVDDQSTVKYRPTPEKMA